jgi:hypothetical protein
VDPPRERTELCSAIVYERLIRELQSTKFSELGEASTGGSVFAMFRLDYLSCALTVLATILLARKSWIGLLIAMFNSLIVCAIALRTSQLGLIPANMICICIYGSNMRSWLHQQTRTNRGPAPRRDMVADGLRTSPAGRHRAAASAALREAPLRSFLCVICNRQGHRFTYLGTTQFQGFFAADLSGKHAAFMVRSHVLDPADIFKAVITTPACRKQINLDVGGRTKEPSILIPTTEREPDRICLPGAGRKGE